MPKTCGECPYFEPYKIVEYPGQGYCDVRGDNTRAGEDECKVRTSQRKAEEALRVAREMLTVIQKMQGQCLLEPVLSVELPYRKGSNEAFDQCAEIATQAITEINSILLGDED